MDAGKIVGGVVILLAVAAGPLWVATARGNKDALALPRSNTACLEPREQMRKNHPALLAGWRDQVVRLGQRTHKTADGREIRVGLTSTCLDCHGSASQFCDRCHGQQGVTLSCWQCHSPLPQKP